MSNQKKVQIKPKKKERKYLGLLPVTFFILGIINIQLAIVGVMCFVVPFYLLLSTKSKVWCNKYCARTRVFDLTNKLSPISGKVVPKTITNWKKWFFYYFLISVTNVFISTVMVGLGYREPMEMVKFLIVIPVPIIQAVQLVNLNTFLNPVLLHLSYRLYSMLFTTITLGVILSTIYKPRTWCAMCPYNVMATSYIKSAKK